MSQNKFLGRFHFELWHATLSTDKTPQRYKFNIKTGVWSQHFDDWTPVTYSEHKELTAIRDEFLKSNTRSSLHEEILKINTDRMIQQNGGVE